MKMLHRGEMPAASCTPGGLHPAHLHLWPRLASTCAPISWPWLQGEAALAAQLSTSRDMVAQLQAVAALKRLAREMDDAWVDIAGPVGALLEAAKNPKVR